MAVTNCSNLTELGVRFDSLISCLRSRLVLRDAIGHSECGAMLKDVERSVCDLDVLLMLMKTEVSKQKAAQQDVLGMKKDVSELHKRVLHASTNLPAHLPKQQNGGHAQLAPAPAQSKIPVTPKHKKKHQQIYTPLLTGSGEGAEHSNCSPGGVPSVAQIKKKAPFLFIPNLEYLTVGEFEQVPKYQRGRLTYEQVNAALDEFNAALEAKYKLMATAKSKQNDRVRKAIWDYKEQESKDTKGVYFVTEKDLKSLSKFKMDSVGRAILTILRHCMRVREVRSKGIVRFAAVL